MTFNENQLRSHLAPIIAIPEVEEVLLVADVLPPPLRKVRAVVPSPRSVRLLGRAGSKLSMCVRLARRLRPDWILSWNIMPHGVNGYLAGRAAGRPTMYHMIGGPPEWEGGGWATSNAVLGRLPRPIPPLERALVRVIRNATVVGVMGEQARRRLLEEGVDPARVVVTRPSIDVDRFRPTNGASPAYDIVTAAALLPVKRLHDLIATVARLRATRPALRAAIVGDGPLRAELERCATAHGVADAVDFLGQRRDVERVYRQGRVFMLPSSSEGLSIAMCEAMACGLPAVVSEVGELSQVVRSGHNGFLAQPGDIVGFADGVARLLDDRELYATASAAARSDIVAGLGVDGLRDLYRGLLVGHAMPERGGAP